MAHAAVQHRPAEQHALHLSYNLFVDGVLAAAAWLVTLFGVLLLWTLARRSQPMLAAGGAIGGLLGGVGLFNLAEAVISHHLLGLHNVREVADPTPWNIAFLLLAGVLPLFLGALLRQRSSAKVAIAERRASEAMAAERVAPLPERAHLVQMLIPFSSVNAAADGDSALNEIKGELTERFGDATTYTRTPAGPSGTEREEVVVFEVVCGELDLPWWRSYRERLERQLRKPTIIMRAEPVQLL